MNCEASSIYPHRKLLEGGDWTVCCNDWTDLMCMARVGKGGTVKQMAGPRGSQDDTKSRYVSWAAFKVKSGKTLDRNISQEVDMTRGRIKTVRVCVFHIGQGNIKKSTALCGEILTTMLWECMLYQVDFVGGDGNKACYTTYPSESSKTKQDAHILKQYC